MEQPNSDQRLQIILVGGGHAHIQLMDQARRYLPYADVMVISPVRWQLYSGMASGYIEGTYGSSEISFDLAAICQRNSITWIHGSVNQIDAQNQTVFTDQGECFHYHILSVNTGSESGRCQLDSDLGTIIPLKPLEHLDQLKALLNNDLTDQCKITVIGGGAAGFEMSLAVQAAAAQLKVVPVIRIFERNPDILKGYSPQVRQSAHSKLQQAGITLTCNRDPLIRAVGETAEDPLANQDLLIWAAGSRAGSLYRESGLPIDPGGFLQVEATLQSTAHPNIFGAGDCISLKDHPELPKVGVYAIRQAPVLCDNIESYIRNKPLRRFKPQTQFLSILNSAHKTAILQWRGVTMSGRLPYLIKDAIDRRFMRRYQ